MYLHPNHFTHDPAVLDEFGFKTEDRFNVVRFVSWQVSHDIGQHGIIDKIGLIKALQPYGGILISSEKEMPTELRRYQIRIAPEKLHKLL